MKKPVVKAFYTIDQQVRSGHGALNALPEICCMLPLKNKTTPALMIFFPDLFR